MSDSTFLPAQLVSYLIRYLLNSFKISGFQCMLGSTVVHSLLRSHNDSNIFVIQLPM